MNKIVLFFVFCHIVNVYQVINSLSPVCSYAIRKIPMDGCRITFSLRLHVIQHSSIGIFPYCVNKQGITNIINLHLTTLDERLNAGRQREPATGSENLLVGMIITIPVWIPSKGLYTSVDARACVNDDYFDLPTFANRKISIRKKKSDIGDFEPYGHTTLNGFRILYCTKWHPKLLRFLGYKATGFLISWISLKIMILGNLWGGKNK